MIGRPQGRGCVQLEVVRRIGVAAGECHAPDPPRRGPVGHNVVERLGRTLEYKRVPVARRQPQQPVDEGWVHILARRKQGPVRVRLPGDLTHHVHIAIGELEGVEVAKDDEGFGRVGILSILNPVSQPAALFVAFLADPFAVIRVVDTTERSQMHRDEGRFELAAGTRKLSLEDQRRSVKKQRAIPGQTSVGTDLRYVEHPRRIADQETDIDTTEIISLHQIRVINDRRVVLGYAVGEGLESVEIHHLLHRQHVR